MMDSLGSIGMFVRVAERLGFSAVARELGASPSSVGKAIARLEERLGVRLFHRSTRTLSLTTEGVKFLESCRRILSEVEAAESELTRASQEPYGKLRVSLPRHSGLFEPAITEFMQRYPAVELDLEFSDRLVDVIGEGFDVAVRTGVLADSGLKHRRLRSFRRVLVGSPAYFARHGRPEHPVDLQEHSCLHYRFPSSGRLEHWPLAGTADEQPVKPPLTLVCNSVEMRIHLALNSQGIACLPDFIVGNHLREGRLQSVLENEIENSGTMWIVWPDSRHLSPKLRVFIDCITRIIGDDR